MSSGSIIDITTNQCKNFVPTISKYVIIEGDDDGRHKGDWDEYASNNNKNDNNNNKNYDNNSKYIG